MIKLAGLRPGGEPGELVSGHVQDVGRVAPVVHVHVGAGALAAGVDTTFGVQHGRGTRGGSIPMELRPGCVFARSVQSRSVRFRWIPWEPRGVSRPPVPAPDTVRRVTIDHDGAEFPYRQLAVILRQRITAGEYPPGRQLPSIMALMAEFELAAKTVQRAIAVLAGEGLVVTVPNRGTFVTNH
jgi:GntR family transcriptional regulator